MNALFHARSLVGIAGLFLGLLALAPRAAANELTFDISDYEYEEIHDAQFFMSDDSKPFFASIGLRHWDRPETDNSFGYMYTGELTTGKTDYLGKNSGSGEKRYYKGRFEGYAAFRFHKMITPFAGLGYRQLYDDGGGGHSANGGTFYDRKSQYLYMPLGVRVDPIDKLYIKAQYNVFIAGRQTSYLSDTLNDYPDVRNNQHEGWGTDVTVNYEAWKNWSVYSFYRYWNIERSQGKSGDIFGRTVTWSEPDNTTQEIGVGIAFRF